MNLARRSTSHPGSSSTQKRATSSRPSYDSGRASSGRSAIAAADWDARSGRSSLGHSRSRRRMGESCSGVAVGISPGVMIDAAMTIAYRSQDRDAARRLDVVGGNNLPTADVNFCSRWCVWSSFGCDERWSEAEITRMIGEMAASRECYCASVSKCAQTVIQSTKWSSSDLAADPRHALDF